MRYGRGADRRPSYICGTLRSDYGLPLCQATTASEVEAWVAEQVLEALRPAVLEASLGAAAEVEERRRQVVRHWEQRIERSRYEADRAARQYHACEPENRLVARTLERRWEEALQAVQRLEADFDRFVRSQPRLVGAAGRERIRRLAGEVPALWRAPTTAPAERRQVVRLLVDRVVLTVDPDDDRVAVRVEWAGGAVRERTIHRAVQGYRNQQSWSALAPRLAELHVCGEAPKAIAAILDREGFRPPKRASGFTAGMVRRLLHELGLRPRAPRVGVRRGPVPGRVVVARPGAGAGPLAAHAARLAEGGLAPGSPGRRPGRAMGGVGGRVRTEPPAGAEGVPSHVAVPGAVGRFTGPGTASWMTASVPSRCPPGGTDASHNFLLGGYCARLIENSLHWVLDVCFREDDQRHWAGNSAENLSWLRKLALCLLKAEKNSKGKSIATRRLLAGWKNDYRLMSAFWWEPVGM